MTPEDGNLMEWAFKGLISVVLTIGGWLGVMLNNSVRKNHDDIVEHKLHVSDNYARKSDISAVFQAINEIQRDIKTLLQRHDN